MLKNLRTRNITRSGTQILILAALLSLMILAFEVIFLRGRISPWALVPLALGGCFIDRCFTFPLVAQPVHYYHLALLSTFIFIDPTSAVFGAFILTTVRLLKDLRGSFTLKLLSILQFMPALLSIWILERLYIVAGSWAMLGRKQIFFPTLCVITGYYLLHTAVNTSCLRIFEPFTFFRYWRKHHLMPTILFLTLAAAIALIHYFSNVFGNVIYLLVVPLAVFVMVALKIQAQSLEARSQGLKEQCRLNLSVIETLALAIDSKHQPTFGHVKRVQVCALGIAERMKIHSRQDLEVLQMAALLHDIGKLAVPEYILSKPGQLTDSEHARMKRYIEIGANILEPIGLPDPIVPIIRHHHEHYNGTGSPLGLKMDEIPWGARILAVADAFDTLTASRSHHQPPRVEEALATIERESGTSYDPEVVKALSSIAYDLAQEISELDASKRENPSSPQPALDSPQEPKQWLRRKGFDEITSTRREVYALYEIYQTVGKSLNPEATMKMICEKLKSLLPFSACVVYLKDKNRDTIYPAMVTGDLAESLHRVTIGIGEGLTGYAIAFNQPIVNADPTEDFKSLSSSYRPRQLINSLIFPLKVENHAFGAIALYSAVRGKDVYSEDQIQLMETVSTQAAVSLHNALSFESYEENSLTDPLTGLPNSRFMFKTFEQNVEKAERLKEKMVILVMDLNNFKAINDQYGHKAGDDVLIRVSRILQGEMRKYDTCIRYGGDEFVAFLYNADRKMSERIVARIKKSIQSLAVRVASGREVRVGISIGMSLYPEDGCELNQLFTVADSQMYNDKFESKSENAQQDRQLLKEAISLEDDIEFQRVN